MHDPTKILLGSTPSNIKNVSKFDADPTTYKAGLAVRRSSSGGLTLAKASGEFAGVSLGKSLSDDIKTTNVLRSGLKVPIILKIDDDNYNYVEIGQPVWIDDASGEANAETPDDSAPTTVSKAVYKSLPLDGIQEDGSIVKVALIDFIGGL